ncbi:MAG TPA: hypothetical protein VFE41_07645 [Acetobacteraceae bacterium]|jgi:hypothetical protein|nr:hypothetical protein [Acetobacteraceae bacterium]
MRPCGFAAGIAGVLPQAGSGEPYATRRNSSGVPPTNATVRAKTSEKLNALFRLGTVPPGYYSPRSRER